MATIILCCLVLNECLIVMRAVSLPSAYALPKSNQLLNGSFCSDDGALLRVIPLAGELCNLSYERPPRVIAYMSNAGWSPVSVWYLRVRFGEIVGQVWLFNDRRLFVVFRGTASFMDGLLNSRLSHTTDFSGLGKVHAGFESRYRRMKRQIDKIINSSMGSLDKIIFTGHSLGGAIAMLAALDFAKRNSNLKPDVITFGSPKVGDKAFGEFFNFYIKSYARIVVDHDPVVALPPRFLGYDHVTGGCLLVLRHRSSMKGLFEKLEAHRLDTYQANIRLMSQ
jgi:hypothetical protein